VNEKMPNKHMYVVESKDITWEYDKDSLYKKILQVLNGIAEGKTLLATYYQVNLGSKKTRESIATVIVDEL